MLILPVVRLWVFLFARFICEKCVEKPGDAQAGAVERLARLSID
ncbi:MAG: hypothetical protein VX434_06765 [Pseudomonadota bacterium]|nr:hypothetical protein [Pseudomonadota bacterium]